MIMHAKSGLSLNKAIQPPLGKKTSQTWLYGFDSHEVVFHMDPFGGTSLKCHGNLSERDVLCVWLDSHQSIHHKRQTDATFYANKVKLNVKGQLNPKMETVTKFWGL